MNLRLAAVSLVALFALAGCAEKQGTQTAQQPKEEKATYAQTVEEKKPGATDKAKSAVGMGSDREFVNDATQAGLAEVKLGRIGATRASNPKVKAFAKMMVEDHSKANNALTALAAQERVALPKADANHSIEPENKLSKLKGAEFDKEFMDIMVADHKKAVSLFESESKKGENKALRGFAGKTLPTLKHHLQMAEKLEDSLD